MCEVYLNFYGYFQHISSDEPAWKREMVKIVFMLRYYYRTKERCMI